MNFPFEITGVINKRVLVKIRKYLIPSFLMPTVIILCTIFLALAILFVLASSFLLAVRLLTFALILYITYRGCLYFAVKTYVQMLEGYCHTAELSYRLIFQENTLDIVFNASKEILISIPYTEFVKIIEKKDFYLLLWKDGFPIIIDKGACKNDEWKFYLMKKSTRL